MPDSAATDGSLPTLRSWSAPSKEGKWPSESDGRCLEPDRAAAIRGLEVPPAVDARHVVQSRQGMMGSGRDEGRRPNEAGWTMSDLGAGSPSRRASLRPRRWRSATGDDVRRTQDHLAEPPVGRLADLAASLQRFQVIEDEIHGLVAPREGGVAYESLDSFDDG